MNFTRARDAGTELAAAGREAAYMAGKMADGEYVRHSDTDAHAVRYIRERIRQAREAIGKIEAALGEEPQS